MEISKVLTTTQQLSVQAYVDRVSNVYSCLTNEDDLSPRNPKVNAALHDFVMDTMAERNQNEIAAILGAPEIQSIIPSLRQLLGRAEHEMEYFCAAAMIDGKIEAEPRFSSYRNFIYRQNYEALITAELHAMKWRDQTRPVRAGCESIALVGAGPLPMSAIMLHQRTGLRVTCIDSSEKACQLGRQLIFFLAAEEAGHKDIDKMIHFIHASGEEHDYRLHPVIFIASLVESKEKIIGRIMDTSNAITTTIIRSAEGLSTLLYRPADDVDGQEKYDVYLVGKTRASPDVINTSLIYRFPAANKTEGRVARAAEVACCSPPPDCFG
jgi:hypothetical protein